MITTISLVRHGLVDNPRQLYYGRLAGFALAPVGREQAVAAGRLLAGEGVAMIYHSPLQRAAETAGIIRAQLPAPVPLVESPLLIEIHSPYDGRPVAEMVQRNWDFYSDIAPPYELPEDVLGRLLAFFEQTRAAHPGQHVLGVSHGDPIVFAILWAFNFPLLPKSRDQLNLCGVPEGYPSPACVASFEFDAAGRLAGFRYRWPAAA